MSYVINAFDESGTPVLFAQRSGSPEPAALARSRIFFVPGPIIQYASATLTIALAAVAIADKWPTFVNGAGSTVPVTLAEKHRSRSLKSTPDGLQYTRTFLIEGTYNPLSCRDIGPQVGDADDEDPNFIVARRLTPRSLTSSAASRST